MQYDYEIIHKDKPYHCHSHCQFQTALISDLWEVYSTIWKCHCNLLHDATDPNSMSNLEFDIWHTHVFLLRQPPHTNRRRLPRSPSTRPTNYPYILVISHNYIWLTTINMCTISYKLDHECGKTRIFPQHWLYPYFWMIHWCAQKNRIGLSNFSIWVSVNLKNTCTDTVSACVSWNMQL